MEEKKTTKEKKNGNGNDWTMLLLDGIFRSIRSFVDGALESVHETAHLFTRRLARRAFLFFFALLGFIFLFSGFAKLLSTMYRFPGAGETIVGIFILLIVLVVYAFHRDE